MLSRLDPPLVPRDAHVLKVILVCRVSTPGPGRQSETSPADQERLLREWLARAWDEPVEVRVVAGSGSGENLERKEFLDLTDLVESNEFDLVLAEDLGRIVRRLHAHMFAETCIDHGVRLIALNDHVDTATDGWQDRSIFSAWHHERSNRDTSERIKRAHRASFERGGAGGVVIYGIVKPPGAKTDAEWSRDPEAEPIYREWFRRLDRGEGFAAVADWLNESGIPTGPGTKAPRWDGTKVGRVTRNPIIKGWRFRNKHKSRRNAAGKYRSVKADPDETQWRHVPHLAFIEEAEYDRILEQVEARNARFRRRGENGRDTRRNVPRKRTRFPGQSLYCGVCGRLFVLGGNGEKDRLMCIGAHRNLCWNGASIHGPLAAGKLLAAIWSEIEDLPAFDDEFAAEVNREADRHDADRAAELAKLDREVARLERETQKVLAFVRRGDDNSLLRTEIARLGGELDAAQAARGRLRGQPSDRIEVPSVEEVKSLARDQLSGYATDDPSLVHVVRTIAPRIVVFPHQLFDGGLIRHRARFRLHLANLLGDERSREVLEPIMERIVEVDLFEAPQRDRFRRQVVRHRANGLRFEDAAQACGITTTAAQRAFGLQCGMDERGLEDPWLPLSEPPTNLTKFCRHLHPRYEFQPLENAGEL